MSQPKLIQLYEARGPCSSVGIATELRAGRSGIESNIGSMTAREEIDELYMK